MFVRGSYRLQWNVIYWGFPVQRSLSARRFKRVVTEELAGRKLWYRQRSREFHKKFMRNYTWESMHMVRYFQFFWVFVFSVTISKYRNDRDMGRLITRDSFTVSSGCMEILIQEPKMKSIWYLPEMLSSCTRYEVSSEIQWQLED